MSGSKFLLDTNAILYILGVDKALSTFFDDIQAADAYREKEMRAELEMATSGIYD